MSNKLTIKINNLLYNFFLITTITTVGLTVYETAIAIFQLPQKFSIINLIISKF